MKVITFSRSFPAYHPRKGEPTYFVEKIANCIEFEEMREKNNGIIGLQKLLIEAAVGVKMHTIRAGSRWKAGDVFSARYWSDKPYRSPQVEFAQIEIKTVWSFELYGFTIYLDGKVINNLTLNDIAKNDGLSMEDFRNWFNKKPFIGQIICWDEKISYT